MSEYKSWNQVKLFLFFFKFILFEIDNKQF